MAYVITDRCVKCGACESECPNGAIIEEEKKFAINYVKCVECGNCIDNCYNKAIDEKYFSSLTDTSTPHLSPERWGVF